MNYCLRHSVEVVNRDGEYFLVSKKPLYTLRLNRTLADLVGRGVDGKVIAAAESERGVMEQLVAKGFAERVRTAAEQPATLADVSIIIPVMNRADELRRCLTSLSRLSYPHEKLQIIVVDDGSSDASPDVAREFGALVVPSGGVGRGPAAARNVGASMAEGDILAFIDSDCSASSDWLCRLIPAFNDASMAAVGGQVDGMCTESAVDRYEAVMSSLSISTRERVGNSGTDTFYLPSCNLLVRLSAFRNVGGFDDSMHVGEDVDLTWRLRDRGWSICYLPYGNILHEHRSSIRSFMSRRFEYGTSEGMLQLLHPTRHKRMVIPPLLAALILLCLMSFFVGWWSLLPACGLLLFDAAAVRLRTGRQGLPLSVVSILAGRLRALGSLVYYLSYHLVRYYATPLIVLALFIPVMWLLFGTVVATAAAVDYTVKKPKLPFYTFVVIYMMEQLAYGAGVFWGCSCRRCFSSYHIEIFRHIEQTV